MRLLAGVRILVVHDALVDAWANRFRQVHEFLLFQYFLHLLMIGLVDLVKDFLVIIAGLGADELLHAANGPFLNIYELLVQQDAPN